MQPYDTPNVPIRNGIAVLSGYDVRVCVDRRHLIVNDGIGRHRRTAAFAKAPSRLRRLIVLGHTGSITFDAFRWLHDSKAAFLMLDPEGSVLAATGPRRLNDARLRRAQAAAMLTDAGHSIARTILDEKIQAQANLLTAQGYEDAGAIVARFRQDLTRAEQPKELLRVEAGAAAVYFSALAEIPVVFATPADQRKVPAHWRTFGARASLLTGGPHKATNPAQALLNYGYALLEAETRLALLAIGLDPGIGLFHSDRMDRDSLVFDVMEPARPAVDAFVLNLLRTKPLRAADLFETREGQCRLLPTLTHALAESMEYWSALIAPIVERVAETLFAAYPAMMEGAGLTLDRHRPHLPTPLTQRRRRTGREAFRRPNSRAKNPDTVQSNTATEEESENADLRRSKMSDHQRANKEWETQHGADDPARELDFIRDVLPVIKRIPLQKLADATGLSIRACSKIRRGLLIPHRRHWQALLGTVV